MPCRIQRRGVGDLGAAVEDRRPGELGRVLIDAHRRARITSAGMSLAEPPATCTDSVPGRGPRRSDLRAACGGPPGGPVVRPPFRRRRRQRSDSGGARRRESGARRRRRRRLVGLVAPGPARARGGRSVAVRARARVTDACRGRDRERGCGGELPDLRRDDRHDRPRARRSHRGGGRAVGRPVHQLEHARVRRRARGHDAGPRRRARARPAGDLRPQPQVAPMALTRRRGRQRERMRARRAPGQMQPIRGGADDRRGGSPSAPPRRCSKRGQGWS